MIDATYTQRADAADLRREESGPDGRKRQEWIERRVQQMTEDVTRKHLREAFVWVIEYAASSNRDERFAKADAIVKAWQDDDECLWYVIDQAVRARLADVASDEYDSTFGE